MYSEQDFRVHKQSIRNLRVKLELLNENEFVVNELQGKLINGSFSIDKNSAVRRVCNLTFVADNPQFIPEPNSFVWFNRKFRLFVGIVDLFNDETVWFNKGIYVMNRPSMVENSEGLEISIEGLDKMCLYNGVLGGVITHTYVIEEGMTINDAIYGTLYGYGERKFNMDDFKINDLLVTLPYTIERAPGSTVYDVIREIADLYMDWSEIYFDENGYFKFQQGKERTNDPVIWNFEETDFSLNYQNAPNFENIKNHIQVWGKMLDNGIQIEAVLKNEDVNNDYSIPNIGEKIYVFSDEKIYTTEQADLRAEYELKQHSNLNESINIKSVPIYMLDVGNLVYVNRPNLGITGTYLVDRINSGLSHDSTMDINAYKLYN